MLAGDLAVFGGEDPAVELDGDELGGEREVEAPLALGMEPELLLGVELHDGEVPPQFSFQRARISSSSRRSLGGRSFSRRRGYIVC